VIAPSTTTFRELTRIGRLRPLKLMNNGPMKSFGKVSMQWEPIENALPSASVDDAPDWLEDGAPLGTTERLAELPPSFPDERANLAIRHQQPVGLQG
jgi:hypothetical protein